MVKRILTVVAMLALAGVLAWWFWPRDARAVVVARVHRLGDLIGKEPGESGPTLAAKTLALEAMFTATVQCDVQPISGQTDGAELASIAARYRGMYQAIELSFSRVEILSIEPTRAQLRFLARMRLRDAQGTQEDTRLILAELANGDDGWRFSAFADITTAGQ